MREIADFDIFACTITGSASGVGRLDSPSSGRGHVALTIEPYQGPDYFLLDWAVDEDTIPSKYRASVVEGIQSVAAQGDPNPDGEYGPLVGIKVTVTGGSFDPKQSMPEDYKAAAALAFQEALSKTKVTGDALSKQRRITRFDMLACTITHGASGQGVYKRQTSGRCYYGHVILTIEPYQWERHLLTEWAVDEDTIPKYFQEAVFTGIRRAASEGVPEFGPLVHLHVTVTGGSFHPVDSGESSYIRAAILAFKDALSKTEVRSVALSE